MQQTPQNPLTIFLLIFVGFIFGFSIGVLAKDPLVKAMTGAIVPDHIPGDGLGASDTPRMTEDADATTLDGRVFEVFDGTTPDATGTQDAPQTEEDKQPDNTPSESQLDPFAE
jgi:hypothetical protein